MMTLFDEDYVRELYVKDCIKEKFNDEAKETAIRMIKKGKMSIEEIADCVPSLSLEELKKLEAEVIQSA